jgi:calcineurin-like phosphoesterase family protein
LRNIRSRIAVDEHGSAGRVAGAFAERFRMRIAQVTDLHIGFEPDNPAELNRQRLVAVLARVAELRPDLLLLTGDLTERADRESYWQLRIILEASGLPFQLLVGNHDRRAPFETVFPGHVGADGFTHRAIDMGPVRLVCLDTLEEGRHSGAFCDVRAVWLDRTLAAEPDRPTMVALHHPPLETGIAWMTAPRTAPWAGRLARVIAAHPQVSLLVAGHVHRPMAASFAGRPLRVCAAAAPQIALDLAPLGPEPDGRAMVVAEAPGFALHVWDGTHFLTHFGIADRAPVIVRHDEAMQRAIAPILAEHAADRQG